MTGLLAIGECMVELRQAGDDLMRKSYAGDTFNAAYYARLFLSETSTVDYLSAVGTDAVSDDMLAFMRRQGVGTGAIRRIEGRTPGLYMIHLKDGERSFSYWRSASAARALADDPQHLRAAIEAAGTIVFSGITLAILAPDAVETLILELRRARASGKRIVFDPNIRPRLWDDPRRMLTTIEDGARAATLIMPSFDDEQASFGDTDPRATVDRYQAWGARGVIVKNGAGPITLAFDRQPPVTVESAPAERIVDTTSAGDSFNGAFLARLLEGQSPPDAARFAARVSAGVIAHHGALVGRELLLVGRELLPVA